MDSSAEKLFSRSLHRRLYEDIILSIGKHKWTRVKFINDTGIPYSPAVSKVNKGVAFNFLTGKKNPDPILEFYSPGDISEIFESHSPEIVEDYGVVDDFTVYIRK